MLKIAASKLPVVATIIAMVDTEGGVSDSPLTSEASKTVVLAQS
jgi:hypothetical protein